MRDAALAIVKVRGNNPYLLNRRSWEIIVTNEGDAKLALHLSQHVRNVVDCSEYAPTEGLAFLRLGQHDQVVEVLTESVKPDELRFRESTMDEAEDLRPYYFTALAIAHHHLGNEEAACQYLASARDCSPESRGSDGLKSLLAEAEMLLNAKSVPKE